MSPKSEPQTGRISTTGVTTTPRRKVNVCTLFEISQDSVIFLSKLAFSQFSSTSRARRRRVQPAVDDQGLHADVPLLEGEPAPAVDAAERVPHLRNAALVEHSEGPSGSSRTANTDVLIAGRTFLKTAHLEPLKQTSHTHTHSTLSMCR
uniref:(northern house mosquito) hypothetical protein n=1 Tax=Culex pipiens TaxID=7175 RepID=A0A8D8BJ36_CULPI